MEFICARAEMFIKEREFPKHSEKFSYCHQHRVYHVHISLTHCQHQKYAEKLRDQENHLRFSHEVEINYNREIMEFLPSDMKKTSAKCISRLLHIIANKRKTGRETPIFSTNTACDMLQSMTSNHHGTHSF